MALNLSPEVIIDLIFGSILMIGGILLEINAVNKRVKPLLYYGFVWIFIALYYLLEALAILLLSFFLVRIYSIMIFPAIIFQVITLDYSIKEKIGSYKMSITFGLGFILIYLAFQLEELKIINEGGYPTIIWPFIFDVFSILMLSYLISLTYLWALLIWFNLPQKLKKRSYLFIIGFTLMCPINFTIYLLIYIDPLFVIIADIFAIIGGILIVYMMIKEPKILFILPFKAYTLVVIHRTANYPLFSYSWTTPKIDQDLFTCIISATEKMSMEVLLKGGIRSIDLEDGVLLLEKSDLFVVGLLASKCSKYLRDCLNEFTKRFEKKFKSNLINTPTNTIAFESAQELIDTIFAYIRSFLDDK